MIKSKRYYYFAYGSNMLQERLEQRVGRVKKIGTGFLQDYQMKFTCAAIDVSFANIGRRIGSRTFGVIYQLTSKQLRILDEYEQLYYRITRRVNNMDVVIYISYQRARVPEFQIPPVADYVRILLAGYRQNGYMEGYRELQEKIRIRYGRLLTV